MAFNYVSMNSIKKAFTGHVLILIVICRKKIMEAVYQRPFIAISVIYIVLLTIDLILLRTRYTAISVRWPLYPFAQYFNNFGEHESLIHIAIIVKIIFSFQF